MFSLSCPGLLVAGIGVKASGRGLAARDSEGHKLFLFTYFVKYHSQDVPWEGHNLGFFFIFLAGTSKMGHFSHITGWVGVGEEGGTVLSWAPQGFIRSLGQVPWFHWL
jgi:hypothetical protein